MVAVKTISFLIAFKYNSVEGCSNRTSILPNWVEIVHNDDVSCGSNWFLDGWETLSPLSGFQTTLSSYGGIYWMMHFHKPCHISCTWVSCWKGRGSLSTWEEKEASFSSYPNNHEDSNQRDKNLGKELFSIWNWYRANQMLGMATRWNDIHSWRMDFDIMEGLPWTVEPFLATMTLSLELAWVVGRNLPSKVRLLHYILLRSRWWEPRQEL